jgi:eukaryotic-like serine/threonine-protein kinase
MVAPGDVAEISGRAGRTVNAIRSTTFLGEPACQLIAAWADAAQPRDRPTKPSVTTATRPKPAACAGRGRRNGYPETASIGGQASPVMRRCRKSFDEPAVLSGAEMSASRAAGRPGRIIAPMPPPGEVPRSSTGSRREAAAGLDTSEGRTFVRDRLALLGKMAFLLSGGFYLAMLILIPGLGIASVRTHVLDRGNLFHLFGTLSMGLLWLIAPRRHWQLRTLGMLDAGALLVTLWCWAGMINFAFDTAFVVLLAGIITVMARAVIVPSSGGRTFWLSLAALAPITPAAILLPGHPPVPMEDRAALIRGVNATLWILIGVITASVASRVIYGLRRRVQEVVELGQYTLEEELGTGGMGQVWRARHRLLIRPAAIKLIRPQAFGSGSGDPNLLRRRFEREALATAALRSPHTVQLYDFGVAEDGTLYYVMELLDGFNLQQLVRRFGPLPAERVVHILHQACFSLAEAHHNGLIHRDIKHSNIFVSRVGMEYDFVKVLDFGLVKLEHPREAHDASLTAAGATTGTPAFMAPEVVLGERPTDHRVDIYSLGCVAYWLLTGSLVFEGGSGMRVMFDHARTPPVPPSTRVELPIPPDLERLVLDCLEKDPAHRPASAYELVNRLERCALLEKWGPERASRWWNAHAPNVVGARPLAEALLANERRPAAGVRPARPHD